MSTAITTYTDVRERTTCVYSATILDEANQAIPALSLATLTLTLYAERSGTIINSRSGQDILNENNVTVSSGGVVTWVMQPADNIIVDTRVTLEPHIALFQWTYGSGGSNYGKHEVKFVVRNLVKVT